MYRFQFTPREPEMQENGKQRYILEELLGVESLLSFLSEDQLNH